MGKNFKGKRHKERCKCPLCSNKKREERQYAALKMQNGDMVIIDAQEMGHLDEFISTKGKKQPDYPKVEPDDGSEMQLVYGVLIPQYDSGVCNWNVELRKYVDFALGTLEESTLYVSAYQEYELYPDDKVYNFHIPCALLMDTSLDLKTPKDYGFGSTAFILYKNLEIFDNIFNRDFLFCLGGVEDSFEPEHKNNWKEYIDKKKLLNIAQKLF